MKPRGKTEVKEEMVIRDILLYEEWRSNLIKNKCKSV